MKKLTLTRFEDDGVQTRGALIIEGTAKVYTTLELAWKNNAKRISCIPTGTYEIEPRWSSKYGHHYKVNNVKERSAILIHRGNYFGDTAGCILVGIDWKHLDEDKRADVAHSSQAMYELNQLITKKAILKIQNHEN